MTHPTIPQALIERVEGVIRDKIKEQAGGHEVTCLMPPDYKKHNGWSIGKSTLVPSLIAEAAIKAMMRKMEWDEELSGYWYLHINNQKTRYGVSSYSENFHNFVHGSSYVSAHPTLDEAKAAAEQAALDWWAGI